MPLDTKTIETRASLDHAAVRDYYNREYYRHTSTVAKVPSHYRRLARRFEPWQGKKLLDIGCGTGAWLKAVAECGANLSGVDISQVALDTCRRALPSADLHCGPAESLPFTEGEFDFISCLGALEHFLEPQAALREMIRVARPGALFLLLVPNAGFLTRPLGFYAGTQQAGVREEVRSLRGWQELFESVGLRVCRHWRDLHVLSPSWIFRGPWYGWPLRAGQLLALLFWPLSCQYIIYHHCMLAR